MMNQHSESHSLPLHWDSVDSPRLIYQNIHGVSSGENTQDGRQAKHVHSLLRWSHLNNRSNNLHVRTIVLHLELVKASE
jgi:hypothetical protein